MISWATVKMSRPNCTSNQRLYFKVIQSSLSFFGTETPGRSWTWSSREERCIEKSWKCLNGPKPVVSVVKLNVYIKIMWWLQSHTQSTATSQSISIASSRWVVCCFEWWTKVHYFRFIKTSPANWVAKSYSTINTHKGMYAFKIVFHHHQLYSSVWWNRFFPKSQVWCNT